MSEEVYSKEEARSLKTGLWVALFLIAVGALFVAGRKNIEHAEGGKYYSVMARYNRTDGLLVGDLVRLAGMTVGRVVDAKLDDNFKAILTLEIKDGVNIPDDSSASIVSSGLMGPKYIEIEAGGSEDYIPAGGEFSYTQDAMVIEELLDRIVSIGKANRNKNK
ncbi:MAG: outer membrane lipid asymmetry maintenance protein MlaD [Alphaproteobacteria bacterium]|nr:outer membrane lipid asymmetry maintenance protein MlaD [Alphaproteobacteria bacterium]MBQ8631035.1 outer membrane lipid asymmetry maintenance protein MlaD [Alphaproteobacteria bacterium]